MYIMSGLPMRDCTQLLCSLCCLFESFNGANIWGKYLKKSIPMDAHSVIHRLTLKPSYTAFVSCPKCSACYLNNGPGSYPSCALQNSPWSNKFYGWCLKISHH